MLVCHHTGGHNILLPKRPGLLLSKHTFIIVRRCAGTEPAPPHRRGWENTCAGAITGPPQNADAHTPSDHIMLVHTHKVRLISLHGNMRKLVWWRKNIVA